jgi:DNA-binding response OmpR family regulator
MTGESKSENVIAAKKAGVNSYIVKPFNAQMLKIKIEAALATKTTPPFRSGTAQQLSLSLRKSVKLKAPSRRPLPRPSD